MRADKVGALTYDPGDAVAALRGSDGDFGRIIDAVGPCALKLRRRLDPFQALLRAIVYQQLSGKAAGAIYDRVVGLFEGGGPPTAEQIVDISDGRLRGAGLSRAKVAAVNDLARRALDGTVPSLRKLKRMEDGEIIERLTQVRGVGRWTVEMLLIFRLGRPDVLPVSDLGVRRGFMVTYGGERLPTPAELADHGQRWAPYRSVAAWYLWRASELRDSRP